MTVVLLVLVLVLSTLTAVALFVAGRCLARVARIEEEFGWHERVHDHLVSQAVTDRVTTG